MGIVMHRESFYTLWIVIKLNREAIEESHLYSTQTHNGVLIYTSTF